MRWSMDPGPCFVYVHKSLSPQESIDDCRSCVKEGMKIIVCMIKQIWSYEEIFPKMAWKCNIRRV